MRPWILACLLLATVFTLAAELYPRSLAWTGGGEDQGLAQVLLGEGRRVVAEHLFVQADVYFHSGYYPSMFEPSYAPTNSRHLTLDGAKSDPPGESSGDAEEHEKAMRFLAPPLDWIERFGRRFAISEHTHLAQGKEREILPWLRLSADLDPHRVETYTVAAFWLRQDLGKAKEAEQFLREGLAENPTSYEILFELGRLYEENYHDPVRAGNNWRAALRRWLETQANRSAPDRLALGQISVRLARLEENAGHYREAIALLNLAIHHQATPHPEALREQVRALQVRLGKPAISPGL